MICKARRACPYPGSWRAIAIGKKEHCTYLRVLDGLMAQWTKPCKEDESKKLKYKEVREMKSQILKELDMVQYCL